MLDAKQFPLIDVSEFPLVVDGRSIRTAKREPISLDMCSDDARAFAACINSYVAHCGPNAIECAEGDLLGEMIDACKYALADTGGPRRDTLSCYAAEKINAALAKLKCTP
jgi:hypothetical protein